MQDSRMRPSSPSAVKGNSKFEILLAKIISLKQNTNQVYPALQKNRLMFLQTITSSFL